MTITGNDDRISKGPIVVSAFLPPNISDNLINVAKYNIDADDFAGKLS